MTSKKTLRRRSILKAGAATAVGLALASNKAPYFFVRFLVRCSAKALAERCVASAQMVSLDNVQSKGSSP